MATEPNIWGELHLDIVDLGGGNEVSFRKTMRMDAVRIDDVPQLILRKKHQRFWRCNSPLIGGVVKGEAASGPPTLVHHLLPHIQFVIQAQPQCAEKGVDGHKSGDSNRSKLSV